MLSNWKKWHITNDKMKDRLQMLWSWNIVPEMNGRARYHSRSRTYPTSAPSPRSETMQSNKNTKHRRGDLLFIAGEKEEKSNPILTLRLYSKKQRNDKLNHFFSGTKGEKIQLSFLSVWLQILSSQTARQWDKTQARRTQAHTFNWLVTVSSWL